MSNYWNNNYQTNGLPTLNYGNQNNGSFSQQFGGNDQNTFVGGPNVTNTTVEDQKRLKKEKNNQFWNAATNRETGQYIAGSAGVTQAVGQGIVGESYNPNLNMHRPGAKEMFDLSLTKSLGALGPVGGVIGLLGDTFNNWGKMGQYRDTYAAAEQQWKNREESRRRSMLMGNDYTASTMGGGGFPGGYANAKYGGSFDDETIEIEPYEAILTKGKDGKYKKYLETGGGVERHENNGFKTKAPKGAYVFPAQYLKDINRYLETENWSAIDKLKDQMMIESTAASMANLPYSNQSPAQQKLNEMVKGSAEQVVEEGAVGGEETFTGRYGGKTGRWPQKNITGHSYEKIPAWKGGGLDYSSGRQIVRPKHWEQSYGGGTGNDYLRQGMENYQQLKEDYSPYIENEPGEMISPPKNFHEFRDGEGSSFMPINENPNYEYSTRFNEAPTNRNPEIDMLMRKKDMLLDKAEKIKKQEKEKKSTHKMRYGGKVPQYNMGGMVSQQNPYMSGMYGQMPNQIPAQTYGNGGMVGPKDPPKKKGLYDVRYHKRDQKFLERQMKRAERQDKRSPFTYHPYEDRSNFYKDMSKEDYYHQSDGWGSSPYRQSRTYSTIARDRLNDNVVMPGMRNVFSKDVYDKTIYESKTQTAADQYYTVPFVEYGSDPNKQKSIRQIYDKQNLPNFSINENVDESFVPTIMGSVNFQRLSPAQKKEIRKTNKPYWKNQTYKKPPSDLGWRNRDKSGNPKGVIEGDFDADYLYGDPNSIDVTGNDDRVDYIKYYDGKGNRSVGDPKKYFEDNISVQSGNYDDKPIPMRKKDGSFKYKMNGWETKMTTKRKGGAYKGKMIKKNEKLPKSVDDRTKYDKWLKKRGAENKGRGGIKTNK